MWTNRAGLRGSPPDLPDPGAAALNATHPVSLIVVVKNGELFLREALHSALGQTQPPDEILVVDGGSTDRTAQVARAFPRVRHVLQPDDGLGNARNLGLANARHELIAFLDHDDVWEPAKLELQVRALQADPRAGYSITHMRFFVEPGTPQSRRTSNPALLQPREAGTPSALLARRELFQRLGGFDPGLSIGCDADWFARVRDRRIGCAVVPEVLVRKRLHQGNLSIRAERNRREMFTVLRRSLARHRSPGDTS